MALPKRRHSKSRRNKRRTHQKLTDPIFFVCPQCKRKKLPHQICPYCGHYRGRKIIEIKEKKKEKKE